MPIEHSHRELEAWLILLRAPGFGSATLHALIERYASAECARQALRCGELPVDDACRAWLTKPDAERIAADLEWIAAPGHRFIPARDADYPALLRETPGAPAALFVAGDATALWQPQVAIVGSRSATQGGLAHAKRFADALARAGLAITSGLAEGIDGAAHEAALEAGGATLAVLGTGPDIVYPNRHRELAARIEAAGALVSEFPPGTPGRPEHFPRRNRIIAGLALGTLVVEAGVRSGSLITARLATEQGRDVFAIPGSIHNPLARGCHRLIRQGAALVETAEDVLSGLAPIAARLGATLRERLAAEPALPAGGPVRERDPAEARLLAALGHEALGVDQLAARTGLDAAAIASMLLVLELEGEVAGERGALYVRTNLLETVRAAS